jgi:hypothetical protein
MPVIITPILLYVVPPGFIGQMILLVLKITCPRYRPIWRIIKALFIRLIIRTFQLVFLVGTVFFLLINQPTVFSVGLSERPNGTKKIKLEKKQGRLHVMIHDVCMQIQGNKSLIKRMVRTPRQCNYIGLL